MNKDLLQAIVAIGIGALVAITAIFLLGDFWKDGHDKAEATRKINQGTHIVGAIDTYMVENYSLPSDLNTILGDKRYTKSSDDFNWIYDSATGISHTVVNKENQCQIINKNLGYEGVTPSCSSIPAELEGENFYCCTTN